jgi:undecaprenyl-phosphate galactose phosphotransferase
MARRAEVEVTSDDVDATGGAPPRERLGPLAKLDWRSVSSAAVLMVADWLTVWLCLAVVFSLRRVVAPVAIPDLEPLLPFATFVDDLFMLAPWTLAFAEARLYTRRAPFWDEARRVLYACTLATVIALVLAFAARRLPTMSRLVVGGMWLATIVAVPIVRYYVKLALGAAGLWRKRVLIVGAGDTGRQVGVSIQANPDLGYEPVAFVDDDAMKVGSPIDGLPVYGPLSVLPSLIQALNVKDIVMATPDMPRQRLLHLVASCEGRVQSIRVVPDLLGLASVGVEAEDLDGVLLLNMRWNLAKPWNLVAKRGFDLTVATVAGLALSPLLAIVALIVRLDSPGPVLFEQERMGRGRRLFRCFKFRTMFVDGEARLRTHLKGHAQGREEWERFRKLKSYDPRVTRVGRILRRFSLDELPQLINVFRNEMSLVGPRPYLPGEAERMGDVRETVLKAPPGITGLWQVSGRNNLTFEQRLRLDEYYVRNWSLWMDLVVLFKTVTAVLHGRGAY